MESCRHKHIERSHSEKKKYHELHLSIYSHVPPWHHITLSRESWKYSVSKFLTWVFLVFWEATISLSGIERMASKADKLKFEPLMMSPSTSGYRWDRSASKLVQKISSLPREEKSLNSNLIINCVLIPCMIETKKKKKKPLIGSA